MASDPLDTFMTWMRVEQGRSRNTLSAYKLDLASYMAWLTTQNTTILTVTVHHLERFDRPERERRLKKSDLISERHWLTA